MRVSCWKEEGGGRVGGREDFNLTGIFSGRGGGLKIYLVQEFSRTIDSSLFDSNGACEEGWGKSRQLLSKLSSTSSTKRSLTPKAAPRPSQIAS